MAEGVICILPDGTVRASASFIRSCSTTHHITEEVITGNGYNKVCDWRKNGRGFTAISRGFPYAKADSFGAGEKGILSKEQFLREVLKHIEQNYHLPVEKQADLLKNSSNMCSAIPDCHRSWMMGVFRISV